MKGIIKDSLILFLITVIAGVLLGGVYQITKEPIATQEAKTKQETYKKVFIDNTKTDEVAYLADSFEEVTLDSATMENALTEAGYTNDEVNEAAKAVDASGNEVGYAVTVTAKDGYGGDIKFTVGILTDGTVNGISMLSISETAGLGMRAKDDSFTSQYTNKKVDSYKVTKQGASSDNEIDALSGSTITSKAVTNGVNSALVAFKNISGK